MSLPEAPYLLDDYVKLSRHRVYNFGDTVAGVTEKRTVICVPAGSNVTVRSDVKAQFTGSAPLINISAFNAAGVSVGNIMTSATVAPAVTADGTLAYFYATTDSEIALTVFRPASSSTTGQQITTVDWTCDPHPDSTLGGAVIT